MSKARKLLGMLGEDFTSDVIESVEGKKFVSDLLRKRIESSAKGLNNAVIGLNKVYGIASRIPQLKTTISKMEAMISMLDKYQYEVADLAIKLPSLIPNNVELDMRDVGNWYGNR